MKTNQLGNVIVNKLDAVLLKFKDLENRLSKIESFIKSINDDDFLLEQVDIVEPTRTRINTKKSNMVNRPFTEDHTLTQNTLNIYNNKVLAIIESKSNFIELIRLLNTTETPESACVIFSHDKTYASKSAIVNALTVAKRYGFISIKDNNWLIDFNAFETHKGGIL
tara:strand:- start:545 stop:1042 length:498 start_codon:yes stop_codon:yes gene_type:complete